MGSISGLTEGILMALLFVVVFTAIIASFNSVYNKTYDLGLETDAINDIGDSMQTAYGETEGEVSQTSDGLTLLSSWKIVKGLFNVLWDFISGSWIQKIIIDILKIEGSAGFTIALVFRILFVSTLIFGLVRLFFKVNA